MHRKIDPARLFSTTTSSSSSITTTTQLIMSKQGSNTPEQPSTPRRDVRRPFQHYPTPTKTLIRSVCKFNDAHHIPYFKNNVFKYYSVKKRSSYGILAKYKATRSDRCRLEPKKDLRGRAQKLTPKNMQRVEDYLKQNNIQTEGLS